MASRTTFREAIKFCYLLGHTPTKTLEFIKQAYGSTSVSRALVFKWHRRFSEGRVAVEDDKRPVRPVMFHNDRVIEMVKKIVDSDRRVTISGIMSDIPIAVSYGTIQDIITNSLCMSRVCARWIPRLLTEEQKQRRVMLSQRFLDNVQTHGDEFLTNIVTTDETWVYTYDPESKAESSVWKHPGSPPPKKARVSRSVTKVMIILFFDQRGVVLTHTVPHGQTVNGAYFSKVIV